MFLQLEIILGIVDYNWPLIGISCLFLLKPAEKYGNGEFRNLYHMRNVAIPEIASISDKAFQVHHSQAA